SSRSATSVCQYAWAGPEPPLIDVALLAGSNRAQANPQARRTRLVSFRQNARSDQYESELITSPPAIVPSARQVTPLTEFLAKCTLPSANRAFTPPLWKLLAASDMKVGPPSFSSIQSQSMGTVWP